MSNTTDSDRRTDTVYVSTFGRRGGTPRVLHTDRDCTRLAKATSVRETTRAAYPDDTPVCAECAGTVETPTDQDHSQWQALADASPDDLRPDGGVVTGPEVLDVVDAPDDTTCQMFGTGDEPERCFDAATNLIVYDARINSAETVPRNVLACEECWRKPGREVRADGGRPEHQPVDGGFVCDECGAVRETPLGMARHRTMMHRDVRTDGGTDRAVRHRRSASRGELWIRDGGDGLPVPEHDGADQFWLFTCCECGRRWVDPPAPVSGCGCGSDQIVCHRFDPDAYWAIKRHGDPRARTDGGVAQTNLGRDPTTREVASHDHDEDNRPLCPDCGQYVGPSKGGGKPLPGHEATAFGWECADCELTLPSNCHGEAAPMFNDHMAGLEVLFRDGTPRWVPVPARFVEGGASA